MDGPQNPDPRWFGGSLRKVHTLYVSPQWAHERGAHFDADETIAQLCDAGADCIELYTKDHHGVCYFPCSLGLAYPRDIVQEVSLATTRRGMRFIAYFSVAFDNFALGVHPEWRAAGRNGEARRQPPFFVACMHSPYREYALAQLRELVAHVPMDGLWLDIVPFAWDEFQEVWMQTVLPAPCYCISCQAAFQDATGYPLPWSNEGLTMPVKRAAYQFLLSGIRDFLMAAREILRTKNPNAILTYNGSNGPGDPLSLGDLVSIEGHAPHYLRQSFIGSWARGTGLPFEILTSGGLPSSLGGWNGFDQKPPTVLRVEAAVAASQGGSAVIGHVPLPNGETANGQYAGFAAAFHQLLPVETAGFLHPSSMADVAIALLPKLDRAPELWARMVAGAEGVYHSLLNDHVQVDVIRRLDDLSRYRVIILADQLILTNDEITALEQFVASGGATFVIGPATRMGIASETTNSSPLDHLLGINTISKAGVPFAYLKLNNNELGTEISDIPLLVNHDPDKVELNGAIELAQLLLPETGRTDGTTVLWGNPPPDTRRTFPGITLHRFGKGQAIAVVSSLSANSPTGIMWATRGLEDAWLRQLIQNTVRQLLPDPILTTNAPSGVWIILNRHDSQIAVHIIDTRSAAPEHLIRAPGTSLEVGWMVTINHKRLGSRLEAVRALESKHEIAWEEVDGDYLIHLPPVDQYLVLALETTTEPRTN